MLVRRCVARFHFKCCGIPPQVLWDTTTTLQDESNAYLLNVGISEARFTAYPSQNISDFFLTFMESCIARCVFYITNEMQLIQCSLLLSALYIYPSTPAVDSRKVWQNPRLHIQFYKLLMMGAKTARNMYSAHNNKEQCIRCISLVI